MKFRQKIAPIMIVTMVTMGLCLGFNVVNSRSARATSYNQSQIIARVIEEDPQTDEQNRIEENRLDEIDAPETAILPRGWGIVEILNLILNVLTAGVGVAATISIAVAGVMYSTAGSNSTQVSKAKTMILNTVVGIIAYLLVWALLQWLVPGGVLN